MTPHLPTPALTRRGIVGLAGAAAVATTLAACSSGAGSPSASPIKFWDMQFGGPQFGAVDTKIVQSYKPRSGLSSAQYRLLQWSNFSQTFATAVASNTGPAVSSGGGTQAFQYAAQGKIAYADDLVDSWKSSGLYDDFLPGLVDALKTADGHYAAVPQNLDMIILWYSPKQLDRAGVALPTDWQSYLNAAAALKKVGVFGFGTGSGTGNFQGAQVVTSFMIMNGGGLFDDQQKPNCVTPENIEAVDFIIEMAKKGYVDPRCVQYTTTNVAEQWSSGKFGLGWDVSDLASRGSKGFDAVVGSPLTGPSGKKGTLALLNNIMMWKKDAATQKSAEAFLTYYYQHYSPLWTKGTLSALPTLKSVADTKQFQANPEHVKVIKEWQPIAKTWAAPGAVLGSGAAQVDGTAQMNTFAQSVLSGSTTAKAALMTLQRAVSASATS